MSTTEVIYGTESGITVTVVPIGVPGPPGTDGADGGGGVTDGDKGDITVSGTGATWTIDSNVLSTFGRTLTDDADAATARATLGLGTAATAATGDFAAASHTHTAANVTDFSEAVDDRVAALLTAGANITLTYNDAGNSLTIAASGGGSRGAFPASDGTTAQANDRIAADRSGPDGTEDVWLTPGYIRSYLLGLASTWTATQTITPAANTSALISSGGSLTGANAQSLIDLAQTWNTSGTPTAIKLNVTNTASNANSLLFDLQTGGISRFSVRVDGRIIGAVSNCFAISTGGYWEFYSGNSFSGQFAASGAIGGVSTGLHAPTLGLTTGAGIAPDVILARDAANTLAQRNGTNAQTLRVYNTFTDASNYERGKFEWASNVLRIGTEKAGTGAARALELQTDGTTRITISTTGVTTFAGNILLSGGVAGLFQGGFGALGINCGSGGVSINSATGPIIWNTDTSLGRTGANLLTLSNNSGAGATLEFIEQTAPAAGATNTARLFSRDNGSGKTQLCVIFNTGAIQVLATEP